MIVKLLAISLGGGIGATLRYLIFYYFERLHHTVFPWPTLIVNLIGSFLIGFLWGFFDRYYVSPGLRMFIFVGILGSFTTFSTFAFDIASMVHDGQFRNMIIYVLASNILAVGLAFVGFFLANIFK
jgi:CrcB protein